MGCARPLDRNDVLRVHERRVIRLQRIDHRLADDRVRTAMENPDAIVGETGDRVDGFVECELAGRADQFVDRDIRITLHAATERVSHRILGAVIRARGDHAGAMHQRGMGDVKLHGHVAARRNPGHRHRVACDR